MSAGGGPRVAAHVVVDDVGAPAPVLTPGDERHLRSVLRLRPGEPVGATDGAGGYVLCELTPVGLVAVGAPVLVPRPAPWLTVAFAPVKGDRPEWAVQKLTELGVDRIVLLQTDRGVVRWQGDRWAGHLARLQEVARQAVMQSRRCWLPAVSGVETVEGVAGKGSGAGGGAAGLAGAGVALAVPGGAALTLATPTVLVGPEGGWSDRELALGLPAVGLSDAVLRTETAAVAAGVVLTGLRAGVVGPPAS